MARRNPNQPPEIHRSSKLLSQQTRTTPVSLTLPAPHKGQKFLVNAFDAVDDKGNKLYPDLRFIVGACGTKMGKTWGCSLRLAMEAWNNRNTLNWWVAPSYAQSKMAYQLVKRLLPQGFYEEFKADLRLVLKEPDGSDHSIIEFKSAQDDDNLRGFGVNFFIFDEAARGVSYESFVSVMTTVTQTEGRGIIISTPKGRNWFYEVFQRGNKALLRPGEPDEFREWMSIQLPSWSNPTVPISAIHTLRRNLPAEVFEQEVAARFLLEGAGVFRGIDTCIKNLLVDAYGLPVWETPQAGHRYLIGVDLARKRDFTVLTVIDTLTRRVVYWDRFNQVAWAYQKRKIVELAKQYNNATTWMDGTGLGDTIVEDVRREGVTVECFVISNKSKQEMIEKLRADIEQTRIFFPEIGTLIRELRAFEYDIGNNGNIKYSAPSGQHDDCVISLALANWGLGQTAYVWKHRSIRGL